MGALERTCKGCGEWALCFDGYCGECAPPGAVDAYVAWWNEHRGGDMLMPIDFFDDIVESGGGQGGGQGGENLDEKESACLVILHSSPENRKIPLHSSPIIGKIGGVHGLHD